MTSDNLLSIARVAELLNLSRSFTYTLVHKGEIPSLRIGRLIRVRQSDLEMYVLTRKTQRFLTSQELDHKLSR